MKKIGTSSKSYSEAKPAARATRVATKAIKPDTTELTSEQPEQQKETRTSKRTAKAPLNEEIRKAVDVEPESNKGEKMTRKKKPSVEITASISETKLCSVLIEKIAVPSPEVFQSFTVEADPKAGSSGLKENPLRGRLRSFKSQKVEESGTQNEQTASQNEETCSRSASQRVTRNKSKKVLEDPRSTKGKSDDKQTKYQAAKVTKEPIEPSKKLNNRVKTDNQKVPPVKPLNVRKPAQENKEELLETAMIQKSPRLSLKKMNPEPPKPTLAAYENKTSGLAKSLSDKKEEMSKPILKKDQGTKLEEKTARPLRNTRKTTQNKKTELLELAMPQKSRRLPLKKGAKELEPTSAELESGTSGSAQSLNDNTQEISKHISRKDQEDKLEEKAARPSRPTRKAAQDKKQELLEPAVIMKTAEVLVKKTDTKQLKTTSQNVTSGSSEAVVDDSQKKCNSRKDEEVNDAIAASTQSKSPSTVFPLISGVLPKAIVDESQKESNSLIDEKANAAIVAPKQSKSPSTVLRSISGALPKIIEEPDYSGEDPYSFEMSQAEPGAQIVKNKPKKRNAKPKPGNKMDLLMQQKTLDAVGNSCSVQHNPSLYEKERKNLEKKINVPPPPPPKIVIPDNNYFSSAKKSVFSPAPSKKSYSKVWHSPQATPKVVPSSTEDYVEPFVSNSPPIQSRFALRLAESLKQARNSVPSRSFSSPFRVPDNLPTAFYMELSGNDGTPTYSSDRIENANLSSEITVTVNKKNSSDAFSNSKSLERRNECPSPVPSVLADSNAENLEPSGYAKTPKKKPKKANRSPLKDLAQSPFFYSETSYNSPVKEVAENNEYLSIESNKSAQPDPGNSEKRDMFGFDELIEKNRQTRQLPAVNVASSNDDVTQLRNKLKRYLPSKYNKDRDKNIFPTTPVKQMNLLKSPSKSETTSIRKYFSSSTPLASTSKAAGIKFNNTSLPEEVTNTTMQEEETMNEESNLNLFDDQLEMLNVSCARKSL